MRIVLTSETAALDGDVSVEGKLEREDCYTNDFVPESGTVTTGLSVLRAV